MSQARRHDLHKPVSGVPRVIHYQERGGLGAILNAVRVHQWVKNVLLFVPLVLAHKVTDPVSLLQALIAFISFSLCSSCVYVVNDLLDLASDRQHPQKRHRPFASGQLAIGTGMLLAAAVLLTGLVVSFAFLPVLFAMMLIGYLALTTAYSLYLKQKFVIDVLMLGGFYAYRVLAGAVAVSLTVTPWLLAFSMFFFLSLAFMKRYVQLAAVKVGVTDKLSERGYCAEDIDMIRIVGPASGYLSVLVLALYISSNDVVVLYPRPEWLWLICLCLLYWLTRIWFLAHRGQMPHDPVMFAIRDRISYIVGVVIIVLIIIAST